MEALRSQPVSPLRSTLKYLLLVTGLLAAFAIACPMLVALGYVFLIVPGLVLTWAPTVFVYLLVTAAVRPLVPTESSAWSTTIAFGAALLMGWLVMQPARSKALAQFRAQTMPDVQPRMPLRLDGHVRIEMPDQMASPQCDYLCLAVLDSPDVQSATVVTGNQNNSSDAGQSSSTYELVNANRDDPEGLVPVEPGEIIRHDPDLVRRFSGHEFQNAIKAVNASWAMRLATGQRLRQFDPTSSLPVDWTIRLEQQREYRKMKLRRVTIVDAQGQTRFCKTFYEQAVPARWFHFDYRVHNAARIFSGASFYVGQAQYKFGQQAFSPESMLLATLDRPPVRCDVDAIDQLRTRVARSLDDPDATAATLGLARRFLDLFHFDAAPEDEALIARIVADARIEQIDDVIANVYSKRKTPSTMGEAFAKRITMDHSSPKLRRLLSECLASMPADTFANPSPTHWSIWKTASLYRDAPAFIESLAAVQSEEAVSVLGQIFDDSVDIEDTKTRKAVMRAVCRAYVRFGLRASSATDRVREVFLERPSPILQNAGDAKMWRVALARMGVPLKALPMFPHQTGESAARIIRQVSDKLDRIRRERQPAGEA